MIAQMISRNKNKTNRHDKMSYVFIQNNIKYNISYNIWRQNNKLESNLIESLSNIIKIEDTHDMLVSPISCCLNNIAINLEEYPILLKLNDPILYDKMSYIYN